MARDVVTCLNVFFGSIALLRVMRKGVDTGMEWHVVRTCQMEEQLVYLSRAQRRVRVGASKARMVGSYLVRKRRGEQRWICSTGFILSVHM